MNAAYQNSNTRPLAFIQAPRICGTPVTDKKQVWSRTYGTDRGSKLLSVLRRRRWLALISNKQRTRASSGQKKVLSIPPLVLLRLTILADVDPIKIHPQKAAFLKMGRASGRVVVAFGRRRGEGNSTHWKWPSYHFISIISASYRLLISFIWASSKPNPCVILVSTMYFSS